MLKNMSVVFSSNARSMFDFIISNDTTEAKGFKWFIENYGPTTPDHLLTIDMLWDYFTAKEQKLSDKVRTILDSYHLVRKGALQPESERVFKTVLLLEAVSQVVSNVSLLRPTSQNIDLAFTETGWQKGKAMAIAKGLFEQGILFERSVGNGLKEYTVANSGAGGADIAKLKNEKRSNLKPPTSSLTPTCCPRWRCLLPYTSAIYSRERRTATSHRCCPGRTEMYAATGSPLSLRSP